MGWHLLRRKIPILALALIGVPSASELFADETPISLGLIAGPPASSETVLAADMASLFPSEAPLRVLPMVGDAGTGNLALLLDDPNVDIAFVSTDTLSLAEDDLGERLELIARLSPQEVHVLARSEIGALADLAGRKVNLGPEGSSSAVTGTALFKALGIDIEPLNLEHGAALERLRGGTISAAVIVSGKPAPLVGGISASLGVRLLAIPFGANLDPAYLPSRFEHDDYPNLIGTGDEVATIATGMALLAASPKDDARTQTRIAHFVETLFARFAELQTPDHHPKWREVNLAASLPGFRRHEAAENWLTAHRDTGTKPIGASAAPSPALPDDFIMSTEEKEALFKRFMDWQRAKGH